jgi:hypothetical protein
MPCTLKSCDVGSWTQAGAGWIHEIKCDGCRLLARCDAAGVRLLTLGDAIGAEIIRWDSSKLGHDEEPPPGASPLHRGGS